MIIDSHAHLNLPAFKKDNKKIIERCLKSKIWLINVGVNLQTSKKAVEIAEGYENGVFASIGLHPTEKNKERFQEEAYKNLFSEKVVAIGEIGLDYYHLPQEKEGQKKLLLQQLNLAIELNLPVIFHCRDAHSDLINILEKRGVEMKAVIHSFTGSQKEAEQYLEMGFYLGFNGIIFRDNGLYKIIEKVPLEKMLIETDCPYLTPPGFSEKRNNPLAVKLIAEKIAAIKGKTYEEVASITFKNARKLFAF